MASATLVSAASSIPYAVPSAALDPRKRRRENSEVAHSIETTKMVKVETMIMHSSAPLVAAQPIVTVRKSMGAKRPQMKYDPSVPMTKEETSAWRREQRRKRNRESAAACRKRQRDRISELEGELNGWKAKVEEALNKMKAVGGEESGESLRAELEVMFALVPEDGCGGGGAERCSTPPSFPEVATSMTVPARGVVPVVATSNLVSPHDRPKFIPPLVTSSSSSASSCAEEILQDIHFPFLEADPIVNIKANNINDNLSGIIIAPSNSTQPRVEKRQHLNQRITRPAVKITGAVPTPLDNIESVCDDLLQVVPDSCLSLTEKKSMPFPEVCPSLVPTVAAGVGMAVGPATSAVNEMPNVTTDESGEEDSDLGEFLLDAVQWL